MWQDCVSGSSLVVSFENARARTHVSVVPPHFSSSGTFPLERFTS